MKEQESLDRGEWKRERAGNGVGVVLKLLEFILPFLFLLLVIPSKGGMLC